MSASTVARALRSLRDGGGVPAVIDGSGACSREELRVMAMGAAGALRNEGVEPGQRVGLLLPRGRGETAALLGAWIAGAVPVPLEPGSPDLRNGEILARCGAGLVMAGEGMAARLGVKAVPHLPGGTADGALPPEPDPGSEAILLHTSGSTGVPKGVPVTHEGVSAFVDWMTGEFGVGEGDRVAALAGPSFDLALFEQLAPLAAGGTILRPPERVVLSARSLARFLDDNEAAFLYAVPSLLVRLLDGGTPPPLRRLRAVLFAGEAFPPAGLRRLMEALPGRVFANLFGPTETNVSLFHRVRDGEPGEGFLPIGIPTPYSEVAIVEEEGEAEAERGEICVRGPAVLRGYGGGGGERPRRVVLRGRGPGPFLRTGDRAERGPDGLLRFRGRRDAMLKVRGYRVEPGEVEAVLASHPGVADAMALREVDPALGEVIVAVVVGIPGVPLDAGGLRRHAALRLPPYMVPARVEIRDRLPRTDRGKRDGADPGSRLPGIG